MLEISYIEPIPIVKPLATAITSKKRSAQTPILTSIILRMINPASGHTSVPIAHTKVYRISTTMNSILQERFMVDFHTGRDISIMILETIIMVTIRMAAPTASVLSMMCPEMKPTAVTSKMVADMDGAPTSTTMGVGMLVNFPMANMLTVLMTFTMTPTVVDIGMTLSLKSWCHLFDEPKRVQTFRV